MKRLWWSVDLGGLAVWLVSFTWWPAWHAHRFTHSFALPHRPALYIEFYATGPLGNSTTMYVTDSTTFRLHAGVYDPESEYMHVEAVGDQLMLTKMHDRAYAVAMGRGDHPLVANKAVYSLQRLRRAHSFNW